jgi:hypothetical protein
METGRYGDGFPMLLLEKSDEQRVMYPNDQIFYGCTRLNGAGMQANSISDIGRTGLQG